MSTELTDMTSTTVATTEITVKLRIPQSRADRSAELGREWDAFLHQVPRHPSFVGMTPEDVKRELERRGE